MSDASIGVDSIVSVWFSVFSSIIILASFTKSLRISLILLSKLNGFTLLVSNILAFSPFSIKPLTTIDYPTPAVRPRYSVLHRGITLEKFGLHVTNWQAELKTVVLQIKALNEASDE